MVHESNGRSTEGVIALQVTMGITCCPSGSDWVRRCDECEEEVRFGLRGIDARGEQGTTSSEADWAEACIAALPGTFEDRACQVDDVTYDEVCPGFIVASSRMKAPARSSRQATESWVSTDPETSSGRCE